MKIIDRLLQFLFLLCSTIVLFGGGVLRLGKVKIEVAGLDFWVITGIVIFGLWSIFAKGRKLKVESWLDSVVTFLMGKRAIILVILLAALTPFLAHIVRHWSLMTDGADQSFIHQALLNAFGQGKILACNICGFGSYMGEHSSVTLMLVSPVFMLFKSDEMIYLMEVFIVWGGLFILLKAAMPNRKGLWAYALFIVFCYRSLRYSMIWEFREDHLGFFFMCTALFSLSRKIWWGYLVSILLVLASKENFPFLVPFLVFPIWLEPSFNFTRRTKILLSLYTVITAVAWFLLNQKIIVPAFNGGGAPTNHVVGRFPGFGSSNSEVIKNVLFSPRHWWRLLSERIFVVGGIKYLILVIAPYLFFLRKRWWWIVAALPIIGMNVLSYTGTQRMMIFHYELVMLPLLIFGVFLAIAEIKVENRKALTVGLLLALAFSGRWPGYYLWKFFPSMNDIRNISYFNGIEEGSAPLATTVRLSAQVTHHRNIRLINEIKGASWEQFLTRSDGYIEDQGGFRYKEADRMLFDTTNPWQKSLLDAAKQNGWSTESSSRDKRFEVIRRPNE